MPARIKILVSVFALIALVSLASFINSIYHASKFSLATVNVTPLPNPDIDTDHDGLTDAQESYWNTDFQNPDTDGDGFKDGEEVASGHDPRIKGPNDSLQNIFSPKDNVTDAMSGLIASGIFSKDLTSKGDPSTYNQAIDNLSLAAISYGVKALTVADVIDSDLNIKSDSKSEQEKYLANITDVIDKNLVTEMSNEPFEASRLIQNIDIDHPEKNTEAKTYFLSKAQFFSQTAETLKNLAVPSSWLEIHKKMILTLRNLQRNHEAIGQIDQDPIKSLVALNNLQDAYLNIKPLLTEIYTLAKKNNLRTPNSEFWLLIATLNGQ